MKEKKTTSAQICEAAKLNDSWNLAEKEDVKQDKGKRQLCTHSRWWTTGAENQSA